MITQLKVQVTWEDTVDGRAGTPTSCAIAKAINRTYPRLKYVRVTRTDISLTDKDEGIRYRWATPLSAREFIEAFDRGEKPEHLEPFYLRSDEAKVTELKPYDIVKARKDNDRYRQRRDTRTKLEQERNRKTYLQRLSRERRGKAL